LSQFSREDGQGSYDFVSDRDIIFESDRDQDGVGDLVFRTAGVERARIASDGTGTGWSNVLGGSMPALPVSSIAQPWYAAHRGGTNVYPENTLDAFNAAANAGLKVVKCDVWMLADGTLGVMHNSTVDATTTSSGNTQSFGSQAWQQLVSDPSSFLAPGYGNKSVPLLADVLSAMAGKAIVIMDCKSQNGTGQAVVNLVKRLGLTNSVIVASFFAGELTAAVAAGMRTMIFQGPGSYTVTATQMVAAGYTDAGVTTDVDTVSYLPSLIAAGIKPHIWTLTKRADAATWIGHGAIGVHSDDPVYISGLSAAQKADTFRWGVWPHGITPGNPSVTSYRGEFVGSAGAYRFAQATNGRNWAIMGCFCPIGSAAGTGSFTFTVTLDQAATGPDTTRWCGIGFAIPDDSFFWNNTAPCKGYIALIRENGSFGVYKQDGVGGSALIGGSEATSTAITAGTSGTFRIDWTTTSITLTRTDVAASYGPNTDSTYRGAYVAFGKDDSNKNAHWSLSAVSVT